MGDQVGTWRWNHISNEWEKVPAVVTVKRMTATGQVVAGVHKLYWISYNPSAANSEFQVSDAIAGGVTPLLEYFHTGKQGDVDQFIPPCPFATGIYLEKVDKMVSMTFGYI